MSDPYLFDVEEFEVWREHWHDMPEFSQEDMLPYQQIIVSFDSKESLKKFEELIGQKLTYRTKSVWFPKVEGNMSFGNRIYTQEK